MTFKKSFLSGLFITLLTAMPFAQLTNVVEIVSPTDGREYHVGDTMRIEWVLHGTRLPVGIVPLISPDQGRTWLWTVADFIETGSPDFYTDSVGLYEWVIPESLAWSGPGHPLFSLVSNQCMLNINLPYDSDLGDYYTGEFSIGPASSAIRSQSDKHGMIRPAVSFMSTSDQHGVFSLSGQLLGNTGDMFMTSSLKSANGHRIIRIKKHGRMMADGQGVLR